MEMPLPEVLDRFTIVRLKVERIGEPQILDEYNALKQAIEDEKKHGTLIKEDWLQRLYDLNAKIWDLEHDIRRGKEGELGLEEVGRRALAIRDLNKQRVGIKNEVAQVTRKGFQDVKMNHASE